jgi:hypothetical protein
MLYYIVRSLTKASKKNTETSSTKSMTSSNKSLVAKASTKLLRTGKRGWKRSRRKRKMKGSAMYVLLVITRKITYFGQRTDAKKVEGSGLCLLPP